MDIEKYRKASLIAQSSLLYAQKQINSNFGVQDIGQICRSIDEFILNEVKVAYKAVKEKGIAAPTEICKQEFSSGIAPEKGDEFQGGMIQDGDLVKISLGVHIDGFTVIGAHTVVIREDPPQQPFIGFDADACVAAYLANEAVISLLSTTLTEDHPIKLAPTCQRIHDVVQTIATSFDCLVVPGSQIRRINRFVAGQTSVEERDAKAVEWHQEGTNIADAEAVADEAWLIDVFMASKKENLEAKIRRVEFNGYASRKENPTVYSRDYSITYNLKNSNSRSLLAKADELSVYPFRLGHFASTEAELNSLRLGLPEATQRRLLMTHPRYQARLATPGDKTGQLANVAREASTIALVSAQKSATGFPEEIRLTGGKQFPPSWVHSKYELPGGEAADLLNARLTKLPGFKYIEVTGKLTEETKMDIE